MKYKKTRNFIALWCHHEGERVSFSAYFIFKLEEYDLIPTEKWATDPNEVQYLLERLEHDLKIETQELDYI